jgi:hypothetical protein
MKKEQINDGADLLEREARVQKLAQKYAYRTESERLMPFFRLFSGLTLPIQALSALFASGGVLLLLSIFNNNFGLIFIIAVGALILLEFLKRLSYNEYNRQRNSTENISKSILIFCLTFAGLSVGSSYVGAPYAVEFFAAPPVLVDTSEINNNFDARVLASASYWSGLSASAKLRADDIHKKNNWLGVTVKGAREAEQNERKLITAFSDSLTRAASIIRTDQRSTVAAAIAENKERSGTNAGWVASLGWWLAGTSLLLELSLFLILFWCSDYEKRELSEGEFLINNSLKKHVTELKDKVNAVKDKIKDELKTVVTTGGSGSLTSNSMQIKQRKDKDKNEVKEELKEGPTDGQIDGPTGRQRSARIWVTIDGALQLCRPGDLRNHIRGNEKTENKTRAAELKTYLTKLENFKA